MVSSGIKNALVCGSSAGIGFASAMRLSKDGFNVILVSRSSDRLSDSARRIKEKTGGNVSFFVADLGSAVSINELITHLNEKVGYLNVLVNNNGGPPPGDFLSFDDSEWDKWFNLTFMSTVRMVRGTVPLFREGGSIINILSRSAKEAIPNLVLSNVFRPALAGLTKTISRELAFKNIRVNSVLPGLVNTERQLALNEKKSRESHQSIEEILARAATEIPMGRVASPEEIASVVSFLASDDSSYITGASIPVDGGALKSNL